MRITMPRKPAVAVAGVADGRLSQAIVRLLRAEQGHADVRTLNRLADEVLRARIALFDAAVAHGWKPTIEQTVRRRRDELLVDEYGDEDT